MVAWCRGDGVFTMNVSHVSERLRNLYLHNSTQRGNTSMWHRIHGFVRRCIVHPLLTTNNAARHLDRHAV